MVLTDSLGPGAQSSCAFYFVLFFNSRIRIVGGRNSVSSQGSLYVAYGSDHPQGGRSPTQPQLVFRDPTSATMTNLGSVQVEEPPWMAMDGIPMEQQVCTLCRPLFFNDSCKVDGDVRQNLREDVKKRLGLPEGI